MHVVKVTKTLDIRSSLEFLSNNLMAEEVGMHSHVSRKESELIKKTVSTEQNLCQLKHETLMSTWYNCYYLGTPTTLAALGTAAVLGGCRDSVDSNTKLGLVNPLA